MARPRTSPIHALPDAAAAAAAGFVLSGIPSTLVALVSRRDLLEGARAAGRIVLPDERRPLPLLAAATVVHAGLSVGWAAVLTAALPRGRELQWSVPAGLAIAALDLGLIGRRIPAIRELPLAPQVADHVAYGVSVGVVLRERRRR